VWVPKRSTDFILISLMLMCCREVCSKCRIFEKCNGDTVFNGFGAHLIEIRALTVFCRKCLGEDLCGSRVVGNKKNVLLYSALGFLCFVGFYVGMLGPRFYPLGQPLS
jgi:hypothetical protein